MRSISASRSLPAAEFDDEERVMRPNYTPAYDMFK